MALSNEHILNICKVGQGKECCRYLLCSSNGFECGKTGSLKSVIDNKVNSMIAQADNCEGVIENKEV